MDKGGETMGTRRVSAVGASAAMALLAAVASGAWAQGALSANLDASGLIRLTRGPAELAAIELNAHGSEWKHAPQTSAVARVSDLPGQAGKQVVGTLPIPDTDGGTIQFTETVKTLAQGLQLEYELAPSTTMRLNGLQLSVLLPVGAYAGQELVISRLGGEDEIVGLPLEERKQGGFQLWSGEGAKIDAAKGAEGAFTVELRAPTDVVVQDLRQWEQSVFEVRFPAIMEDGGREVTADDRFHLDLTITFPEAVTLGGP